ncbi:hypothetical protein QVD17_18313 [Tagetes erecta]|uniref:Protein kinase domain-containing protein n=1 Tax=Tagetes erecta TaxID=13708 RepID=A0AAD8KHI9_TARER|nr:hypothetical protein QVD17_18313 [Tagetes erecta]
MNHQSSRSLSRSWNTHQHQLQSHDHIITQQHQPQSHITIDPLKLVLGQVIDRGTLSVVYKGWYQGQTVAVKVFDFGDNEVTKASMESMKIVFKREVDVWKNLDHPNVTKMIGATMSMTMNSENKNIKSKTESDFCIVSEYVERGSLRSYLLKNHNKKLPMKTVFQFALDIAKGLSYLHSKKLIHFDVKPDNILIDSQYNLKLVDFGGSVFKPLGGLFLLCGEIGTRGYMAPEILSRKLCGHKCDVYSFGICLWEIYNCDIAYPYDAGNNTIDVYKKRPRIPMDCPRPLARLM